MRALRGYNCGYKATFVFLHQFKGRSRPRQSLRRTAERSSRREPSALRRNAVASHDDLRVEATRSDDKVDRRIIKFNVRLRTLASAGASCGTSTFSRSGSHSTICKQPWMPGCLKSRFTVWRATERRNRPTAAVRLTLPPRSLATPDLPARSRTPLIVGQPLHAWSRTAATRSTIIPRTVSSARSRSAARTWLFVGSETAGKRADAIMSLIATAKANGAEPYARLADVLTRLPTTKDRNIDWLLPLPLRRRLPPGTSSPRTLTIGLTGHH